MTPCRHKPLRRAARAVVLACLGAAFGQAWAAGESGEAGASAMLQGLDKTTARVSTFEAPIGAVVRFGRLEITARACHKTPPTEPPESTAFLEIVDARPDSPAVPVFTGWMFASSPAVSALEHPVYDIWVIDCRGAGDALEEARARPEAGEPGAAESAAEPAAFPEDPEGEAPDEPDPAPAAQ